MKKTIILVAILLLAAFLRFYQLGVNPPSLAWDEAALGYNAYSIGETGRDEFGRFLPYDYFASFGDYKPPLYVYAAVLPVKIFGLNEFAVRFPSAFFGTLTVLLTYFLVQEMFPSPPRWAKPKSIHYTRGVSTNTRVAPTPGVSPPRRWALALLAALFLAISPWHTQLSRAAWEANLASFFIVLGVLFFLKSLRGQGWFLLLSALAFGATFYTFNSTRIFSPILVFGLVVYYRKELWRVKQWVIVSVVMVFLLLAPLIPHLLSREGRLRFQEVNIFTDLEVIETTNRWMAVDNYVWWSRLIHNRRVNFALLFLEHYFHHFEGKFLFISGDGNPKFSLQEVGQLYLFDLPFLLTGIYFLIRRKEKVAFPIFWWLLVAPLPAATARETPHALRILDSLPTWQIITAYGFYIFLSTINYLPRRQAGQLSTKVKKFLIFSLCFLFLIFNFLYYLHHYYAHYPAEFSGEWQYGYREMIESVAKIEEGYDRVVVTKSLGRPYIYFLFYRQYPPQQFWQFKDQVEKEAAGFINVNGFGKYQFGGMDRGEDNEEKKTLFVMVPKDVPGEARIIETIERLNGETAFVIFD